MPATMENGMEISKILKIESYDQIMQSSNLTSEYISKELKSGSWRDICIPMFIVALPHTQDIKAT